MISNLIFKFFKWFKKPLMTIFTQALMDYGKADLFMTQNQFKFTERKLVFAKIATITNKIEGDYLEFGIYEEESFILAYK